MEPWYSREVYERPEVSMVRSLRERVVRSLREVAGGSPSPPKSTDSQQSKASFTGDAVQDTKHSSQAPEARSTTLGLKNIIGEIVKILKNKRIVLDFCNLKILGRKVRVSPSGNFSGKQAQALVKIRILRWRAHDPENHLSFLEKPLKGFVLDF